MGRRRSTRARFVLPHKKAAPRPAGGQHTVEQKHKNKTRLSIYLHTNASLQIKSMGKFNAKLVLLLLLAAHTCQVCKFRSVVSAAPRPPYMPDLRSTQTPRSLLNAHNHNNTQGPRATRTASRTSSRPGTGKRRTASAFGTASPSSASSAFSSPPPRPRQRRRWKNSSMSSSPELSAPLPRRQLRLGPTQRNCSWAR